MHQTISVRRFSAGRSPGQSVCGTKRAARVGARVAACVLPLLAAMATADVGKADTAPAVDPAHWHSVFEAYLPFTSQPAGSWAAANRRVAEAGGWQVYAMEPYQDTSVPAQSGGEVADDRHTGTYEDDGLQINRARQTESETPASPAPAPGHQH